jgi:lipopolysaccharide/colanic/teichoic acid biosynthesis glycosyltransferase
MAPLSMRRFWHKSLLVVSDLVMLNLALLITYLIRFHSGLFNNISSLSLEYYLSSGIWLLMSSFFILLFVLNGLYSMRWDISRFDQVLRVSRVILFGALVLFLITLDPRDVFAASRLNIVVYSVILIFFINSGRLVIIYIEKKLSVLEYSPHNTLLIGSNTKAKKILQEVNTNPHLLYQVVGLVSSKKPGENFENLNWLGNYSQIPTIIRENGVEEVIIALEEQSPDEVLNIVAQGENMGVTFKVIPELYDVISGLKSEEVLGHPLIKLFPEHMLPWQWLLKRFIDFFVATISLFIISPLLLIIVFLQMLLAVRPIFQIENRVGRHGKIFGLVQFNRGENKIGDILLKSKIYQFPRLLNVLIGSLSLVGPLPESKETIEYLRSRFPFYNRRFMIRPGMTGWAQLRIPTSTNLEIKEEQFRLDLFYLENMSLVFDIRIIVRALLKLIIRR